MTTATTPLRRLLLRGTFWATSGRLLAILASLAMNVVLARVLAPDDLGAFFLIWSTATFATTLGTLGVDQVTVRWLAEARASGDAARARRVAGAGLRLAVAGAIVAAALMLSLAPIVFARLFTVPQAVPIAGWIAAWVATNVVLRQLAESFRGYQSILHATLFNGLGKSGILANLGLLAVAVYLLLTKQDALGLVYALATAIDLLLIVLAALTLRSLGKQHIGSSAAASSAERPVGRSLAPALAATALPVFASVTVAAVRVQADLWILGAFAVATEVAIYGAVLRLVLLVVTPLQIVNAVLPPIIAELHARGEKRLLEALLRTSSTLIGAFALLVVLGFALFGGQVLALLFGPLFAAGKVLLLILATGHLVNVAAGSCDFVLLMTGNERPFFYGSIVGMVVMVGLGITWGSSTGAVGVAAAAALALFAQNLYWLFQVRRRIGIWTHVSLSPRVIRDGVRLLRDSAAGGRAAAPGTAGLGR